MSVAACAAKAIDCAVALPLATVAGGRPSSRHGAMLLSPRSRRSTGAGSDSSGSDIEAGSNGEHELGARQRSQQLISPRNSSNTTGTNTSTRPHAFFPPTFVPPSSWQRRLCPSSTVPVLMTALLCTLVFWMLHLYLTSQMGSTAEATVQLLTSHPPRQQPTRHATSTQSDAVARQQHLLTTVESCLRQHPSYTDPYTDTSRASLPHSRRARPFPPLPIDCLDNLTFSTHEHALLQLTQLIHRMHASDGELDYFDPLANRLQADEGPAIPYTPLPSIWLQWAPWDDELDAGDSSVQQTGGDCELLLLGEGRYAHRQSVYAVRDSIAHVDADDRHHTIITTTSAQAQTDIKRCMPTSGQPGQEQDNITVTTAAALPQANASYAPRPPVTYLLSRHNSANPWHSLIEHLYPQWLQMFLRGDFPYSFQHLTAAFAATPSNSEPSVSFPQPHFDLLVYHETGAPNGPQFDGWWHILLGAPVRYLRAGDSVSCSLCILGPPKALAVYDYWGGSRFVYDSATQFMVRLFRRHVYARVDVAPWRVRADGTPSVTYSFQRRSTTYWRPHGEEEGQRLHNEYVLPDFPRLLEGERLAESNKRGRNVSITELSPSAFDFSPLADPSRSTLITGNCSWHGWNASQHYTALSSLPLVVLTRRHVNHERTLRPFANFLAFYQQPAVAASLPYHLLLLYIEDLPLADQVALLSSASVLLTVEGASEINQLYLPLRSVVVEVECDRRFYDGNRPRPWHQSLGQYLGHLFIQWSVEGCDRWDDAKALRLHEILVRALESTARNRYVYMS